jgi:hypothetical protein
MGRPGTRRFQAHPCRCPGDISCSYLTIRCSLLGTLQRNRSRHHCPWRNICHYHTQYNPKLDRDRSRGDTCREDNHGTSTPVTLPLPSSTCPHRTACSHPHPCGPPSAERCRQDSPRRCCSSWHPMLASTCLRRTVSNLRFLWLACTRQRDTLCKQIKHFRCIQQCIHTRPMFARQVRTRTPRDRPHTGPPPGSIQHCRSKTWRQDQTWRNWDRQSIELLPGENTGRPRTTRTEKQKWRPYWARPCLPHSPGTLWQRP